MMDRAKPSPLPLPDLADARHQLPEPPSPFVGREAELKDLLARVGPAPIAIHGVSQTAGIGKTALALALSHRIMAYYCDAQLYVDLRGDSAEPLGANDALAYLIQCMLPGACPPDDAGQLRAQYLSVLAGKRALLLLDNAADAEQVRPLLPPPSCATIITARRAVDLPGAHAVELTPLGGADAQALIERLTPHAGPVAQRLAELCDGVPLALCTAGGLLAQRPDLDPHDYLHCLAQRHAIAEGADAADLVLGINDELMLPEHRGRWHALAVFPAGFDQLAAATVWDLPPGAAGEALEALHARSLVRYNPATRRFRLHDRARLMADMRISPADRLVAQRRHALHYAALAAVASTLCDGGPNDLLQAMTVFRVEWPNLRAAFAFASANITRNRLAAKLCTALAESCANWLLLRIPPAERLAWLEPGLAAARIIDDTRAQFTHLRNLSTTCEALGDERRSRQYAGELLSLSVDEEAVPSDNDPAVDLSRLEAHLQAVPPTGLLRARILWRIGRAHAAHADLPRTLDTWRQAMALLTAEEVVLSTVGAASAAGEEKS